jgi:hypothetical protein
MAGDNSSICFFIKQQNNTNKVKLISTEARNRRSFSDRTYRTPSKNISKGRVIKDNGGKFICRTFDCSNEHLAEVSR